MALTPAGESLLSDATALLQQITDIELRVRRISLGDVGHLRIGFVASATLGLVPAVALAFKRLYPGVSFDLKNMSTVQQVEALQSGTIDAGFVRLPLRVRELSITTVDRESFAIVLSKSHPLARKADLEVGDLREEAFIAYGERWAPAFYQNWTGLCRAAGFTPNVIQETAEMDTAIALVAAGLGVAILPEGITHRNRKIVAVKVLQQEKIRSEIGIAVVTNRQTPLLKRLIAVAKEVGRQ